MAPALITVAACVVWAFVSHDYCSARPHTPGFCVEWSLIGMVFPLMFCSFIFGRR